MLIQANALQIPLPDESVHMVATSPPFFGLRDYGLKPLLWGGDGWRGCLGQEPTIDLYISHMLEVFREVWRVLRSDGTLWLSMGDSYANDGKWGGRATGKEAYLPVADQLRSGREKRRTGLPPKSLIGIPWRLALALQEQGWTLRSEIIYEKTNPMPEPVKDRPTKSHEHLFLFSKRRLYYYDYMAIKEPVTGNSHSRGSGVNPKAMKIPTGWNTAKGRHDTINGRYRPRQNPSFSAAVKGLVDTRNKRTVWTMPTFAMKASHFATFPPDLVEPCILAGSSGKGVCPDCSAPWVRIVSKQSLPKKGQQDYDGKWKTTGKMASGRRMLASMKAGRMAGLPHDNPFPRVAAIGWEPSCQCHDDDPPCPVPALVLDPFIGSGTTAVVAKQLGRRCVGLDLSFEYLSTICRKRIDAASQEPKPDERVTQEAAHPPYQMQLYPLGDHPE